MSYERLTNIPVNFTLLTLAAQTGGGDIVCPANTRGLLVGTPGAQDTTMVNDATQDLLPLVAGLNPGAFKALRSDAANTAADIWAIT